MTAFRVKGFIQTSKGLYLADCMGNVVNLSPNSGPMLPEKVGRLVVLSGAGMPIRACFPAPWRKDRRLIYASQPQEPMRRLADSSVAQSKYRGWNSPSGAFFG